MFNSVVTPLAPRFSGAYLDRKDARNASTDKNKEVKKVGIGANAFYLNNDITGHDLDQLKGLTKDMFRYDSLLPFHKQDQQLPARDARLIAGRLLNLHSEAMHNYVISSLPDVD